MKCAAAIPVPRKALSLAVMRTRKLVLAIGLVGVLGSASAARAQWMRLQRCNGALPCAIPFAVRYAPDPLIAAQYGRGAGTAVSGRISLEKRPEVELDAPRLSRDPSEAAARRFLLAHPPPGARPTPVQTPPATKKAPPPSN